MSFTKSYVLFEVISAIATAFVMAGVLYFCVVVDWLPAKDFPLTMFITVATGIASVTTTLAAVRLFKRGRKRKR